MLLIACPLHRSAGWHLPLFHNYGMNTEKFTLYFLFVDFGYLHVSGDTVTKTMEAEMSVARKSLSNMADDDDDNMKPVIRISPPTVSNNDAESLVSPGTSDLQGREADSETSNRDTSATSHTSLPLSSEDRHEPTEKVEEKSDRCSVSCVRDLINTAIEKTLQDADDEHRSLTPQPCVNGNLLAVIVSLLHHWTVKRVVKFSHTR